MAFKQQGFNPGKGTGMGSAFTKKASPLTIAPEDEIMADMDAINVKGRSKKKKNDKTIAKSEYNIAKVKHSQGKISDEELAAAKDKKKKSQTGREKIRTKFKEKKDKRTRNKNINKTKREQKRKIDEQAKWLKNNPNIPMP